MDSLPQSVACSECDATWFSRLEGNTASACLSFSLSGYLTLESSHLVVRKFRPDHMEKPMWRWIEAPSWKSASTTRYLSEWAFKWIQVQAFKFFNWYLRRCREEISFSCYSIKIPDLCKPGEIIHDCCYFKSLSFRVICYTAKVTRTPLLHCSGSGKLLRCFLHSSWFPTIQQAIFLHRHPYYCAWVPVSYTRVPSQVDAFLILFWLWNPVLGVSWGTG